MLTSETTVLSLFNNILLGQMRNALKKNANKTKNFFFFLLEEMFNAFSDYKQV